MALQWTDQATARLSVREAGTTNTFNFEGVNPLASAGTPSQFLDAANRILSIGGQSAVIDDITRTVKQKGAEQ